MLEGWEVGTIEMTTDEGAKRSSRVGSLINREIGIGISSLAPLGLLDEVGEAVFSLTHLATGLRIVAIAANLGTALQMAGEIADLADWTAERPDNLEGLRDGIYRIVGEARWSAPSQHPATYYQVMGHA